MKKFAFLISLSFLVTMSVSVLAQDKKIDIKQLPVKAKVFLNTYYAKMNVSSVKEEVASWFEKNEYKVKLEDGKEIEFDKNGEWKEIDGKRKPIPVELIPEKILEYVKRSFPKTEIIKLKKSKSKYEVAISNGLELEFNNQGKFIKIDD